MLNRLRLNKRTKQNQPGAALLARARLRLTFWYTGVLAIALLLFSVTLYFTAQQQLLQPIKNSLSAQIDMMARVWQHNPERGCPTDNPNFGPPPGLGPNPNQEIPPELKSLGILYVACFDQQGNQIINSSSSVFSTTVDTPPTAFLNNNLALQALKTNATTGLQDILDTGSNVGTMYRYAETVTLPAGSAVIQIGRSVEDLQNAQDVVRNLLVLLGLLTLAGATGGGLFLSYRALAPTRQAFARQQAFIADASHELRTPITLLRTDAEVLLRGRERLDPEDAELLEDIVIEADHLTTLSTNLLELARLDAGQMHLEPEVNDLAELAQAVVRRLHTVASEKLVTLQAEELSDILVVGDSQLLEQLILILLDNAVKYTPTGGSVTIKTQVVQGQICLEVADTGIGITPDHLIHLGERFYRVDKARSREMGGTGLGLSLAFAIAKMHGGVLELKSEFGQGTTVKLILPASRLITL
jgi:signal transduction histidine kinase